MPIEAQAQSPIQYRMGIAGDAPRLATLGMQVWLHTYATEGVSHDIASYVQDAFTAEKMAALLSRTDTLVLVAQAHDHLVGMAVVTLNACCPIDRPESFELATLYVQAHFAGRQIGTRLLAMAEAQTQEQAQAQIQKTVQTTANTGLWLTVNARNQPAIAFYRKHGYTLVGTAYFTLGDTQHENHVMARRTPTTPVGPVGLFVPFVPDGSSGPTGA